MTDSFLQVHLRNWFTVDRVAGATRFETNIEILKKAGVSNEDILVCTAFNFADSLSGSAAKRPILLVGDTLNDAQRAYLSTLKDNKYYIIGGEAAVKPAVENEISTYGSTKRLAGNTRHETSILIAENFASEAKTAVLAYSYNYPVYYLLHHLKSVLYLQGYIRLLYPSSCSMQLLPLHFLSL